MKKNDVILLVSAVLFSGLFYKQSAGINFLLFSLLVSAIILFLNPEKTKDKTWWYYCACSNLSALAVFVINSDLSVFASIIGLIVLSGKSFHRQNSIIACFFFGVYSLASSIIYWIIDLANKEKETDHNKKQKNLRMAGSIAIIIVAVICFFYLYRLSNPLFNNFTKSFTINWLSFGWLCFTYFGFLVLHGLLKSRKINLVSDFDMEAQKDIFNPGTVTEESHQNQAMIAFVIFLMLNVMLLFLNGLDVSNIYITQKLPAGITLSDFVHQAVEGTVFSIIIAVSLIVWFFKSDLNFSRYGKKIKVLVYLWIAQSLLVVINTMVRNCWYTNEYQLTYLRIGVFVFLILCMIGLVLTYFKIAKHQSAGKLAIKNATIWFVMLIAASLVNWDQVITHYNIQHANTNKKLDKAYLITELSDANIPELIQLHKTTVFDEKETALFNEKISSSIVKDRFQQWQSFNLRMHSNQEAIKLLQ